MQWAIMRAINTIVRIGALSGVFVASSLTLFACQNKPARQDTVNPSWDQDTDTDMEQPDKDVTSDDMGQQCDFAADPNKSYVGESPDACATMKFVCEDGKEYFSDACGCGCVTSGMADPNVTPPPGSAPPPETIPPPPAGTK